MNHFDQIAAQFDSERRRIELASAIGDAMIKALSPRSDWRVIDYGAGTGLLSLKLQSHVGQITAVDTSEKMLEVIAEKTERSRLSNIRTLFWNVETDEDLPDSYDAVVGSMVMHHVPDTRNALRRFYSMIKDGGCIALADLDTEAGDFHPAEMNVPHNGFDRDEFRRWLEEAGFRNIHFFTAFTVQKPTESGIEKEYPIFLVTALR